MKSKNSKVSYAPLMTDLVAAGTLGLIAGLFALVTIDNLGYLNKKVFGVTFTPIVIILGFIVVCMVGVYIGRVLSRWLALLYSFVKFGEAGGLNWLVDIGIVNLLILITGFSTGLYFIAFKATSFVVASTNSYFWNKHWVFRGGKKQGQTQEVGKFAIATTTGLVLNVIVAGTVSFLGPNVLGSISNAGWANIATICGSLFAMIFNFILYKIWVFKA